MYTDIYVLEQDETPFPIEHDAFDAALRGRFPQVEAGRYEDVDGTVGTTFLLEMDGEMRRGLYLPSGALVLQDGDGKLWADTIAWFLELLPEDNRAALMTEFDTDRPLPISSRATAAEVEDVYSRLVTDFS
jgi:hypothetical protein